MGTNEIAAEANKLHVHGAGYVALQIAVIVCLTVLAHFVVRLLRAFGNWLIRHSDSKRSPVTLVAQRAKFVTLTGLITSALTLVVYSIALFFILRALGLDAGQFVATYLATASVVGFAVGFGSQGLVQDVITGLTMIFTDTLEVGDMVEISGQVGRVENVGLRFTELRNFFNQQVFLSNRNIANIARYPRGGVHAYVDIQIPEKADVAKTKDLVAQVAKGMWEQFKAIVLQEPDVIELQPPWPGARPVLRVRFKLWPGQGPLIETTFRQRVIDALKRLDSAYADWMVVVTYRAQEAAAATQPAVPQPKPPGPGPSS